MDTLNSPRRSHRTPPTGTQSVDRSLGLLALITEHHSAGASLTTLESASGLARPTVHRLTAALARAGLIERDDATGDFHLGAGSYALGVMAADRFGIHPLAEASVKRLAECTEDTAFFCVRKGDWTLCLNREEGPHPIRAHILDVGQTHPLGVAAHGIAMIAALPDDEIDAVINSNVEVYAAQYPMLDRARITELVDATRRRGWALNAGLFHENAYAVGVVVRDERGSVAGALSVGATADRLDDTRQRSVAEWLQREADRIEQRLRATATAGAHTERVSTS